MALVICCNVEGTNAQWNTADAVKRKPSRFFLLSRTNRTYLEGDLFTDAHRVEYLPKFVSGEALEVVKRNKGCSFCDIIKTLGERFGQTIRVTQACVEDLASSPKLAYGDNVRLMNFS